MPIRSELIAHNKSTEEIAREIGADGLIYQDLADLEQALLDLNPAFDRFESSCFDADYVTGDITPEALDLLEQERG